MNARTSGGHFSIGLSSQNKMTSHIGTGLSVLCASARIGEARRAFDALTRSVALGYTNADWAAEDDDLASLRGLPEFEALLERMRAAES